MPNGAQNLGSQLGQIIFGTGDGNKAYYQGQALGAQVADRMASARKNRADAMIGEDTYTNRQAYDATPLLDPNATLEQRAEALRVGALANLGSNLSSGMDAYSKGRGQERIDSAEQAFRGGDTALGNMLLAASSGKPLETTSVSDGTAYNKYGATTQPLVTTALGDAAIDLRHAQAGASNASAANSYASAKLHNVQSAAGGFNPHVGGDSSIPVPAMNPNGPHGDDYLTTIQPTTAAQVKALAEGRMAFPTGAALKSPYWQGMLQSVAQYDPSFDAVNYNARAGTRKAFTSGKEAQTVNSLNTVAEHLGTLSDYSKDLNNTSFQPYNRLKNSVASAFGDPDISKFDTAKKAVADEIAKVWRSSGGSQADIEENLHNLDGAQSPAQLNAAIGTLTKLIDGKVAALQDQYTSGMGTTQDVRPLVSPEAQAAFDKTITRSGLAPDDFGSLGAATQSASPVAAQPAASARGGYQLGQIIMHNGKQYRVTGGDPNDPDVEPLQ